MGIKLLVLLGLLIGVLYCFHILAQDYQAITAPKLLKLLFKRDTNSTNKYKPTVRWKKILQYDTLGCARYLYCDLGATDPDDELRRSYIYMITLNAKEEDKRALEVFRAAYSQGKLFRNQREGCVGEYTTCPFKTSLLFDLLRHISLYRK